MIPLPLAVGLTLCEQVIVEERTKNVSLINAFTIWPTKRLPSPPGRICLFAVLKEGQGDCTIELSVTREETDEIIFSAQRPAHFPDRLREVQVYVRYNECSFPAAGWYYATLAVDGEWVAQRRFRVVLMGGQS